MAFNAWKCNKAYREIYERIAAKGKIKKLVLIAVCIKLLKQAFSIVKNRVLYNNEFRSALVIK